MSEGASGAIPNSLNLLFASERLKGFLEERSDARIEFLPIKLLDQKDRLVPEPYSLLNVLGVVECVDLEKSKYMRSAIDPNFIARFFLLVLDEDRIPLAPRVRVCQALLARDPEAFPAALLELLERHGAWFRARAGTLQARAPSFELERAVCVEGLALLRLAALHELSADQEAEYPLLPSIARLS
ncbi:imm11 family protein [Corallococcus sp. CA031C]|uniref:imm11 family protein n=1 Tax=Corallococcus sp. CA031C TaxID=2316725 RepID=UPI00351A8DD7